MQKDTRLRSIAKAVSWRVSGTLATILLVFIFTKRIDIAVVIGGGEVIAKMILYFAHERVWDRLKLGRRYINPFVLWFTGLPGSGKSTLADKIYDELSNSGYKAERLDGDILRSIFPNTGFSREERNDHIKRAGFLASLLEKNGVIVIASFISPHREARDFIRTQCRNFIEVYVCASLEECEKRDPKGLYAKARQGQIMNFTGVNAPYEAPVNAELVIYTDKESVEKSLGRIKKHIRNYLE